ncbi:MAG: sodium:alanine symporter family protein [Ruminococcus sp.]|nr:sodium:alanine symporter family protein [Ruminococcus sp.]
MSSIIQTINGYLWGFPMIAFLFLTHIFMTVRTGGIQRKTLRAIRLSVKSPEGVRGGISPFEALSTSLASTLGTGNIIGVGTAVALGGAGAVFWCWITGVFGMATQYAECLLSVKYRVRDKKGQLLGGTMYVLEKGLNSRSLGIVYAGIAGVSGLLTGAAIQSNAISEIIRESLQDSDKAVKLFGSNMSLTGILVGVVGAVLTALVVFGGLGVISRVCSFFVPFMAAAYILGCFVVLYINRAVLADSLRLIITQAFSLRAVAGGGTGSVMLIACRFGMARGLFSNEAGLGTSSIVNASALTPNPVRQALAAMTATFWDTVVMCLVTGVVIVSTIVADNGTGIQNTDGGALCYKAFVQIPFVGEGLLVFGMITFAFSTILGWSWTGQVCAQYIFGGKGGKAYKVLWVIAVLVAPLISMDTVWSLADLCNALLAVPNVYALIMLSGVVREQTRLYANNTEALSKDFVI